MRRSDKLIQEADYHDLKEYFEVAESYFDAYQKINSIDKLDKRSVFIITDEANVIKEAISQ